MSERCEFFKANVKPIKQRIAYQVGSSLYRTPSAAAKAQAWAMILNKYADRETGRLSDTKSVFGLECDCGEDYHSYEMMQYGHECCPIHDRTTGYFARLHKRLGAFILSMYNKTLSETVFVRSQHGHE